MIEKWWIVKDIEGSGRGPTIPEFAGGTEENHENLVRIVSGQRFEHGISRLQSRIVSRSTSKFRPYLLGFTYKRVPKRS
jgi:hypothetical protein